MTTFGRPRRHVAECASTNDLARAWAMQADAPAPHGALVTADFQTRGRGRRGHRWDATAAQSALMSFVLRPEIPLADAWQLGFLAALATTEALQEQGLDGQIKWPNDVLLDGKKVAGVLVETTVMRPDAEHRDGQEPAWVAVAGIGLNVNQPAFEAHDYAYPPTSLRLMTGRERPVEEVVQAVAAALGRWDARFRQAGFAHVLNACRERLAFGATVRRGTETASLVGLGADSAARVRLPDGTFAVWTAFQ